MIQAVKDAAHKAITPIIKALSLPVRPFGMLPAAFTAYLGTGLPPSRIGQTIGNAAASAGTHAQDGTLAGIPYACCVDIHVRDLSPTQVKALLLKMWDAGFAAWYRCAYFPEDHWTGVTHVHAIWVAAPCKLSVRHQVHDFCARPCKTGLASHLEYHFLQPSIEQQNKIATAFLPHNPASG